MIDLKKYPLTSNTYCPKWKTVREWYKNSILLTSLRKNLKNLLDSVVHVLAAMPELREDQLLAICVNPGCAAPSARPASLPSVAVVQSVPMRSDLQQLISLRTRLCCPTN